MTSPLPPAPGEIRFSLPPELDQVSDLHLRAKLTALISLVYLLEGLKLGLEVLESGAIRLRLLYPPPAPFYWPRIRRFYRLLGLNVAKINAGAHGLALLALLLPGVPPL